MSTDYTGQSQNPGRDPLTERLIDVAWVHVATVASPDGVYAQDVRDIDKATLGAVAAVLRELGRNDLGYTAAQLDRVAFEIDTAQREATS